MWPEGDAASRTARFEERRRSERKVGDEPAALTVLFAHVGELPSRWVGKSMEEKPTSRELSLEMIGKTRRISKLTPSAVPSLVARGFIASYRQLSPDGLRPFR